MTGVQTCALPIWGHERNEDLETLKLASGLDLDDQDICPYRLTQAAAPHLVAPAQNLVLGKFAATSIFGFSGTLLTLLFTMSVLKLVPMQNLGMRVDPSIGLIATTFLLVLPLILTAAAIQFSMASFARSFKEAQTWLSLSLFLPMLPGLIGSTRPIEATTWMMLIPCLSQQLLLRDRMQIGRAHV